MNKLKKIFQMKINQKLIKKYINMDIELKVLDNEEIYNHKIFKEWCKHIGEQRTQWFFEELQAKDASIHIIVILENEILITRSFYKARKENTFDELKQYLKLLTQTNYLIGHKLVVNEQHRNKGLASTLINITHKIISKYHKTLNIKYILGDTTNLQAAKLYQKLGAKTIPQKIEELVIYPTCDEKGVMTIKICAKGKQCTKEGVEKENIRMKTLVDVEDKKTKILAENKKRFGKYIS